jgi:death on curing protein
MSRPLTHKQSMAVFLELNGYSLDAPEMEVVLMTERLATDLEDQ